MALYNATGGVNWTSNNRWTSNRPLNEWYGVTTDPSGLIVLELVLEKNQLFGTLPPELGDLANLQRLDLSGNQLQEEIPSELGNLSNLTYLDLGQNQLRGEIPWELGDLTYLEQLGLAANRLDGEIPPVLGDLSRLKTLYLGQNELRGEIPPELGNLTALERLALQDNLLEGSIPQELGDLRNLVELGLSGNAGLHGCLPEGSAVPFCTAPTAVQVQIEGGEITIQWEPVEGATHYNIYYHDGFGSDSCPGNCELEGTVFEPHYVGPFKPDFFDEVYWLAACTNGGCSSPLLVHKGR